MLSLDAIEHILNILGKPKMFVLNQTNAMNIDCLFSVQNTGCTHLRAYRLQNIVKFKNAVVSGVVAIICARHAFYLPQGMVDLTKGEA